MIVYLSEAQVHELHRGLIRAFGGALGIRDRGALDASLARPAMTFGGEDLYPDLAAKAAALFHSLVLNHPFIDGNKRVGAAVAELFLQLNGYRLDAADSEFEQLALATAQGRLDPEALAIWFRQRTIAARP